jgi:hypothetical protein
MKTKKVADEIAIPLSFDISDLKSIPKGQRGTDFIRREN